MTTKSNLELFVLAMVQRGLATPYDLRMKAGLSLGSTVPVLARLMSEDLIKASELGSRRSRRFSITVKGTKALNQGWEEHLGTRPTDLDSILRIAYLAWLNSGNTMSAEFLEQSATGLRGWAGSLRAEAGRLAGTTGDEPDGDTFKWLRTYCEAARADADAAALGELSEQIQKRRKKTKKKNK